MTFISVRYLREVSALPSSVCSVVVRIERAASAIETSPVQRRNA